MKVFSYTRLLNEQHPDIAFHFRGVVVCYRSFKLYIPSEPKHLVYCVLERHRTNGSPSPSAARIAVFRIFLTEMLATARVTPSSKETAYIFLLNALCCYHRFYYIIFMTIYHQENPEVVAVS